MKQHLRFLTLLSALLCLTLSLTFFAGCEAFWKFADETVGDIFSENSSPAAEPPRESDAAAFTEGVEKPFPDENGSYTSKEDVTAYLLQYGRLPSNFITKQEAKALGWDGGSLEPYAPGKSIGGDYFGNYEELLPKAPGRRYTECDIDTMGAKSRGEKRIVFSNDGLIYYTDDHYESFTLLAGNP